METVTLKNTAIEVSRLCIGGCPAGEYGWGNVSRDEIERAMLDAVDLGVNFFDTANRYGAQVHAGYTEEIIGKWLAKGGGRRDKIVLATKVYGPMGDGVNER